MADTIEIVSGAAPHPTPGALTLTLDMPTVFAGGTAPVTVQGTIIDGGNSASISDPVTVVVNAPGQESSQFTIDNFNGYNSREVTFDITMSAILVTTIANAGVPVHITASVSGTSNNIAYTNHQVSALLTIENPAPAGTPYWVGTLSTAQATSAATDSTFATITGLPNMDRVNENIALPLTREFNAPGEQVGILTTATVTQIRSQGFIISNSSRTGISLWNK